MNVGELITDALANLKKNNIDDASLISKVIMAFTLNCKKEDLIIHLYDEVNYNDEKIFLSRIEKIKNGYPLQYITNCQEFMKLNFYVDENVLIPRSDTEILVEQAINASKEQNRKEILELCTGSGAIAISLLKYLDNVNITATDISKNAINVAKRNELNIIGKEKIKFVQSDMFDNVQGKFDMIVSNPPYIQSSVIDDFNLKYEPKIALDGGEDGLDFYRIIINEGYKFLNENGIILLEIGYDQKQQLLDLVKESGKYKCASVIKDLAGNDRVGVIY